MLTGAKAEAYTDFNGLAKLKNQAKKESPEALRETARQFESIFINNVLKSMREAKLADSSLDNDQSRFYTEMYDHQLAMHLSAKGGIGLADVIVKQLGGDNKALDTDKKQELIDYMRSATAHAKVSGQALTQMQAIEHGVITTEPMSRITDTGVTITRFVDDHTPFRPMAELPFKSGSSRPITSAEEFVNRLLPYAEQAAAELGVDPKALIAQAALESGWGKSVIKNGNGSSSFNLFNIKADRSWQGKQARVSTLEFEQGVAKKVQAGFRSYQSYAESFQDYVAFIKNNPRYGHALKHAGNAERYLHELQHAGYATDPGYAAKVLKIYRGDTLAEASLDSVKTVSMR